MLPALILTNGQSGIEAIRASGVDADVISWDDVLHDGPVVAAPSIEEHRRRRARFIDQAGWETEDAALLRFRQRDNALERALEEEREVVVWLEHDLYDQLQRLDMLSRMGDRPVNEVPMSTFIAETGGAALADAWAHRAPVTGSERAVAREAWNAFRAPDPGGFAEMRTAEGGCLGTAIERWVDTFPDESSGLSLAERWTLELLIEGPRDFGTLFRGTEARERARFRGDLSYWRVLRGLARGPEPLVGLGESGGRSIPPGIGPELTITGAGASVLSGALDRVVCCGLDEWRGGSHLTARRHWRRTETGGLIPYSETDRR